GSVVIPVAGWADSAVHRWVEGSAAGSAAEDSAADSAADSAVGSAAEDSAAVGAAAAGAEAIADKVDDLRLDRYKTDSGRSPAHQKKMPSAPSVGRALRCVSVPEMATAGEYHGDAVLVASSDGLVVALRSAGLDDGGDPRSRGDVRPITKREEGVRSQHGPAGPIAGLFDGDSHRVKAAHLPRAHAQELSRAGDNDRIRLDHAADPPGEDKVARLALGRGPLRG